MKTSTQQSTKPLKIQLRKPSMGRLPDILEDEFESSTDEYVDLTEEMGHQFRCFSNGDGQREVRIG